MTCYSKWCIISSHILIAIGTKYFNPKKDFYLVLEIGLQVSQFLAQLVSLLNTTTDVLFHIVSITIINIQIDLILHKLEDSR